MRSVLAITLLAVLVVVLYWPTRQAALVYEDVPSLQYGVLANTATFPLHTLFSVRGLTAATYQVNRRWSGWTGQGWHLTNVAIHLLNGLLLWVVVRRRFSAVTAVLALAIFWLHPLQVEAVAYVGGRSDLLSATAVLLGILAWESSRPWLVLGAMAMGVMAKETGAVVLPLVLLWSGMGYRTAFEAIRENTWRDVVCVLFLVAASIGGWRLIHMPEAYLADNDHGVLGYWALQATAVCTYLRDLIVPMGLTVDHDWEATSHALRVVCGLGLIGLIAAMVRAVSRDGWTPAWIGVGWLLLAVAPRFVLRIPEFLNEHQMYVPMVGLSVALACLLTAAIEWTPVTKETTCPL